MLYPAPVATGNGNIFNFLFSAETGIYIESFGRKTDSKKVSFYNAAAGYTDSEIYHDFKAMYDVKGKFISASNTGVAVASPGVAVTLANLTTGNGVTGGGIYTQNTSFDHTGEQAADFSINAQQLAGLT